MSNGTNFPTEPAGAPLMLTLPDMFFKVPALLSTCLDLCWCDRREGFKVFRLISKGLGPTALKAARSVSLKLGEGVCPDPRKAHHLLQGSLLKHMALKVVTTSGSTAPTVAQQLLACTSQIECLVRSTGPAIAGLTHLDLSVQHRLHDINGPICIAGSHGPIEVPTRGEPLGCPDNLVCVASAVFTMLAAAVPNLVHLGLEGCCRDAALASFGSSCPQLRSLQVDDITVSLEALQPISQHLCNLTHFKISLPPGDQTQFERHVEAVLVLLQGCQLLETLELDFEYCGAVKVQRQLWQLLPPSLTELVTTCNLWPDAGGNICIPGSLQHLTMLGLQRIDLLSILQQAPLLQQLNVGDMDETVNRYEGNVIINAAYSTFLSEVFRAGFVLSCFCVTIEGCSECVKQVLSWLPCLDTVPKVKLHLLGSEHSPFLQDFPRVFPNLQVLFLKDQHEWEDVPGLGGNALKPLAKCPDLSCLLLSLPLELTTASLAQLCSSWPLLDVLQYLPCEGVDDEELERRLQETNPTAMIQWD